MEILLNNRKETFDDNITLNDIMGIKKFTFRLVITTVNSTLIRKENRDIIIKDGDNVNVIHMISGG